MKYFCQLASLLSQGINKVESMTNYFHLQSSEILDMNYYTPFLLQLCHAIEILHVDTL